MFKEDENSMGEEDEGETDEKEEVEACVGRKSGGVEGGKVAENEEKSGAVGGEIDKVGGSEMDGDEGRTNGMRPGSGGLSNEGKVTALIVTSRGWVVSKATMV